MQGLAVLVVQVAVQTADHKPQAQTLLLILAEVVVEVAQAHRHMMAVQEDPA
jgi:hypothetical protein